MSAQAASMPPFHLAFPVRDIEEARQFYVGVLGCGEGRSAPDWVDFDFYGHQVVAHLAPDECGHKQTSAVDDHQVFADFVEAIHVAVFTRHGRRRHGRHLFIENAIAQPLRRCNIGRVAREPDFVPAISGKQRACFHLRRFSVEPCSSSMPSRAPRFPGPQ